MASSSARACSDGANDEAPLHAEGLADDDAGAVVGHALARAAGHAAWGAQSRRVGSANEIVQKKRCKCRSAEGEAMSEAPQALKIGDRVRLRSGGPLMVVHDVHSHGLSVGVRWFDQAGHLQETGLEVAILQVIEGANK